MSRILLLFTFLLPLYAEAGGSVTYADDVAPLVLQRPDLARKLEGLRVAPNGEGTRIGRSICPALAGKRIGPYEFGAERNGRAWKVTFETRDIFRDANGAVVAEFENGNAMNGDDISGAATVEESLVEILLE